MKVITRKLYFEILLLINETVGHLVKCNVYLIAGYFNMCTDDEANKMKAFR